MKVAWPPPSSTSGRGLRDVLVRDHRLAVPVGDVGGERCRGRMGDGLGRNKSRSHAFRLGQFEHAGVVRRPIGVEADFVVDELLAARESRSGGGRVGDGVCSGVRPLIADVLQDLEIERQTARPVQPDTGCRDICKPHSVGHHHDNVLDLLLAYGASLRRQARGHQERREQERIQQ